MKLCSKTLVKIRLLTVHSGGSAACDLIDFFLQHGAEVDLATAVCFTISLLLLAQATDSSNRTVL